MKFGKQFRASILNEWRLHAVDYKSLKKTLKKQDRQSDHDSTVECGGTLVQNVTLGCDKNMPDHDVTTFHTILEENTLRLCKFLNGEEQCATAHLQRVERQFADFLLSAVPEHEQGSQQQHVFSNGTVNSDDNRTNLVTKEDESECTAHEEGRSDPKQHFQRYIYVRKDLFSLHRDIELLQDFLHWNKLAFSKILKKFDKRHSTSIRETKLDQIHKQLDGIAGALMGIKERVDDLQIHLQKHEPQLARDMKECSILASGCFDLFHRGHQNHLLFLRKIGKCLAVLMHDDQRIERNKDRLPIDNVDTRKANVLPYVDEIYVMYDKSFPDYIREVAMEHSDSNWCFFCSDEFEDYCRVEVEPYMTTYYLPRTDNCSSTMIRDAYHS